MSLHLIAGPPNSGRAGEVLGRLRERLRDDPILVVPTRDDAAQLERDLCSSGAPAIGVTVTTFGGLFEDLALGLRVNLGPRLGAMERLALVRTAVGVAPLRALSRSAGRPGFAPAMVSLIDELEAGLVDTATLAERADEIEDGTIERELAAIHAAYVELRAAAGRSDAGQVADAVLDRLNANPAPLADRPVFVYGFDDLTRAQLELVAIAAEAGDLVIAVNFDFDDRATLAARAELPATLRDEIGTDEEISLSHEPGYTSSPTLRHLDRNLFEVGAARIEPDDGLLLLECAGERGEAEAIAVEVARLIADGTEPDDIAVTVRHPGRAGGLIARVLEQNGVPVALEAPIPVTATGIGHSMAALCRAASESGTPDDLLAHLRTDPGLPAGPVDWLERSIRRGEVATVEEAVARWRTPPIHLARLAEAPGPPARLRALARSARELAERPLARGAPLAGAATSLEWPVPMRPVELRAAAAIAELLDELAAVGDLPGCEAPSLDDARAAIEGATVPAWRGPVEGRVRILSPYGLRATRTRFLFCASLQEGDFPAAGPTDPLLGEERRAALGIPALRRGDPAAEERYLFGSCVSRPTERLYLSWRSSDEEGGALARSPFVDDVLDLLTPGPEEALKRVRGPERVLPSASEAPTERALARALALAKDDPEAKPGPLRSPVILADLAARGVTSANSLEGWLGCPYRWFVDHELQPQRLEPESDPLWIGSVVHDALERLYRERPGEDSIPRPGDVERWKRRFGELLDELAEDTLAPRPERSAAMARARAQVESFLEAESETETDLRPRPDLLEWTFGFDEEGPPPLRRGDLVLRGRVDRVDVAPDGTGAVVRDYKTGSAVADARHFEERGSLQIQLYMTAVRDILGLEPIAGLYQPLGATDPSRRRPRGLALRDDDRLEGLDLVRGGGSRDVCEPDELEDHLSRAMDVASRSASRMRKGEIDRRPIGGRCPEYCTFQAICRLERALGVPDENGAEEER
jgi:ATP-dependent helicase/DNAse subunit B